MPLYEGFNALPVMREGGQATHYIFCKKHINRSTDSSRNDHSGLDAAAAAGKVLFIVGLPFDCTEAALAQLMSDFGDVASVIITQLGHNKSLSSHDADEDHEGHDSEEGLYSGIQDLDCSISKRTMLRHHKYFTSFSERSAAKARISYVLFQSAKSVSAAMSSKAKQKVRYYPVDRNAHGMQKWLTYHQSAILDIASAKEKVDAYMDAFERKEQKELEEAENAEGVADDEGWVTVTRKRSTATTSSARQTLEEDTAARIAEKEKKRQQIVDFYRFQQRDARREQLAQLRSKFEDDKKKIAIMRSSRKFKPE